MNKSPQYNQQTEPKQCKSEVEETCIYKNLESGRYTASISVNRWIPCQNELKQQYMRVVTSEMFYSAKSAFMYTTMQAK